MIFLFFKKKKAQYEKTVKDLEINLAADRKEKLSADNELESLSVKLSELQEEMEKLEKEIHELEIEKKN